MRYLSTALVASLIAIIFLFSIEMAFCSSPPTFHSDIDLSTATTQNINQDTKNYDIDKESESQRTTEITQKAYFPSDYDSGPIQIEKAMESNDTNECIVNSPIDINVIIRSKSSYNLTDLIIKEEVDENLIIKNSSAKYVIIDPIDDNFNNISYSHGINIDKIDDNTLKTSISCLRPQEWLAYTYTVVPRKTGFLDADTLIHFGRNSYYKSKYEPWGLDVKPEKFEIALVSEKDQEYANTDIKLLYNIKYLGNNPRNDFCVRLENGSQEFICVNNGIQNMTFESFGFEIFTPTIKYKKTGVHYFPDIMIDGNLYPANGPRTITIDDVIIRNKEYGNLILQIINTIFQLANILVFIYVSLYYREFKHIEATLRDIQKEIQQFNKPNTSKEAYHPWWYR